jgi:putative nucleotidyltransferase with HDIG domain
MILALSALSLLLGAVALILFLKLRRMEGRALAPQSAPSGLEDESQRVKEAQIQTVHAIALTVQTRDPQTARHQQRVAKLAQAIAQELGMAEFEIESVYLAALVHDIGMIYVPSEITNRPGPLTPLEFDIVKVHPKVGHDILQTVKLPWPLAQIILQHHRGLDGSGYSSAMDEPVPVEARILRVADVVEAMCAHRPYRPAPGMEAAIGEIEAGQGARYDERVASACIRLIRDKGFSFDMLGS